MEFVYVVRRRDVFDGVWPQGFAAAGSDGGRALLHALVGGGFFVERREAERSTEWKQLIPYCVLTRGNEVFAVHRLGAGSERRLHGRWSIGLGGHIGPEDDAPADEAQALAAARLGPEHARGVRAPETFLARALRRELAEELELGSSAPPVYLGLVNDDTEDVGRVHAGLVHRVEVSEPVAIREISKLEGGFRDLVELARLWQDPTRFESWSRIVLAEVFFGRGSVHQSRSTSQRDDRREDSRDG